MGAKRKGKPATELAFRLMQIRMAETGDNQSAFARKLGISSARWNNYERGSPLPLPMADLLLRKVDGLDHNFLYGGDKRRLPVDLADRLEAAARILDAERRAS